MYFCFLMDEHVLTRKLLSYFANRSTSYSMRPLITICLSRIGWENILYWILPMMRRNCDANLYDIILLFCRVISEGDFVLLNKTFLYEIQVQFFFHIHMKCLVEFIIEWAYLWAVRNWAFLFIMHSWMFKPSITHTFRKEFTWVHVWPGIIFIALVCLDMFILALEGEAVHPCTQMVIETHMPTICWSLPFINHATQMRMRDIT